MKILVCDDSSINRQLIGAYLKKMDHSAIFANDGKQAIELFNESSPDLVLIDVEMPEMDGYEATRAIRRSSNEYSQWTPIIFLSSHIDDESIVKGIDAGGDDYLTKPVSEAVLKAKIHAMKRLVLMRENLIDLGKELQEANEKLLQSNQFLAELSLKDPLTRVGNRRAFEETLTRVCKSAIREGTSLCILMTDVDNFKLFNDTYGHQAGDDCLSSVAQVLKKGVHRPTDFVARFGGEEFVVLLPNTPLSGGLHVGERLRMAVQALHMESKNAPHGIVTISVGVSGMIADNKLTGDALIKLADAALYDAKEGGRNRVVVAKIAEGDKTAS